MKCVIVDDESLARRLLADYVSKVPELELVGACDSAIAAKTLVRQQEVDLLLLDIQMPDLTGIELLKILPTPPITIFTTAYAEYALEGYSLDVIDYLLKPIPFDRFFQAVTRAQEFLRYRSSKTSEKKAPSASEPAAVQDYFFVKSDYKIIKIDFAEVIFVEGMREYVRIHTERHKVITLLAMQKMEEMLPSAMFARIHRSHIVNLSKINEIQGNTVYLGNHQLPISKGYKEQFLKQINRLDLF